MYVHVKQTGQRSQIGSVNDCICGKIGVRYSDFCDFSVFQKQTASVQMVSLERQNISNQNGLFHENLLSISWSGMNQEF